MKRGVDHIGVTVCFYCYDDAGRLLLQKRSQLCRDEQGTWDCGGGAVEFGESFEEAAIREIQEEYSCAPLKLTFCGVNNVLRTHNSIKTHWVCLVFAAHINPKDVSIGDTKKIEEL
ncbi:MAG: NUDIX domain-containing protein, partial [Candidatus Roizmanbacteria bacterium]|nr:NUDIX domain-containing protein [Candidatus Roizmanbacteria bacterium]